MEGGGGGGTCTAATVCAALWVPSDSPGCTWAVSLLFPPHISHLPLRCRKSDAAVEMDEMVAAMVLTSLSCSPVVQSPPAGESGMPRECAFKKYIPIC